LGKNILQFFVHPEEGEHFLARVKLPGKRLSEQEFQFHTAKGQDIVVGVMPLVCRMMRINLRELSSY
jgi:hypothetical protein